MPVFIAIPPVRTTGEVALSEDSSLTILLAIDRWIPLMISGVDIPRDTILITSVSARTEHIPEGVSGVTDLRDVGPTSSIARPR